MALSSRRRCAAPGAPRRRATPGRGALAAPALAALAALAAACDDPPAGPVAPRAVASAPLPVAPPHAEGAGAEPLTTRGPLERPPPPARSGGPGRPVPAPGAAPGPTTL